MKAFSSKPVEDITDDLDDDSLAWGYGPTGDDELDEPRASIAPEVNRFRGAVEQGISHGPHYDDDLDDFGEDPHPSGIAKGYSLYKDTHVEGYGTPKTTFGGAPVKAPATGGIPFWRRGGSGFNSGAGAGYVGKSKTRGRSGKGYNAWGGGWSSNYGYSYSYATTSYSSWYSGYSSARSAMRGVHRSASSYIKSQDFKRLAIYPASSDSIDYLERASSNLPGRDMHLRIDGTLYEQLGLEKAQQHYTVDTISQVLALQDMPQADLPRFLQNGANLLPRVVREVATEVVRRRGLILLMDEAPGWSTRIEAFRKAMAIKPDTLKKPDPTGRQHEDAAAVALWRFNLLMHAAWLPSDMPAESEAVRATAIIEAIDKAFDAGDLESRNSISREIIGFVSSTSDLVSLACKAQEAVDLIREELVLLVPYFPEPQVSKPCRQGLIPLLDGIKDDLSRVTLEPIAMDFLKTHTDLAYQAGIIGLRHRKAPSILREIDKSTRTLAVQREAQMRIDRDCDKTRVKYEELLSAKRQNSGDPSTDGSTLASHCRSHKLSIMFAHQGVPVPALKAEFRSPSSVPSKARAFWQKLLDQANDLRQRYHDQTKQLNEAVRKADDTEEVLITLINKLPEQKLEPWSRVSSGALIECMNHLMDILEDIQERGAKDIRDLPWMPGREGGDPGEGEGGESDDLTIDDGSYPHSSAKTGSGSRRLRQNHSDLIVDADASSEELPQIGTESEVKDTPEIVIFDATDPSIIASSSTTS